MLTLSLSLQSLEDFDAKKHLDGNRSAMTFGPVYEDKDRCMGTPFVS